MKALTFHGPFDIRVEDLEEPRLEHPGDVILEVEAAGLCGSDLHPYCGRERGLDVGTVMGHEVVGTITDAGSAVEHFSPGVRVVAPFSTSCGKCFYCSSGLTSRCRHGQILGWRQNECGLQGCQAESVRVPLADSSLVAVPDGIAPHLAVLAADILPTGLFAAELGGVSTETTVAVVGCGPVGLLAIAACRIRGARRVLAIDRVAERLALAADLGAVPLAPDRDPVETVKDETGGRGVDSVLEVVGLPAAARLAIDLVRVGGILATVGFHTDPAFGFSPGDAYDRNLTYRTGRCPARRFIREALEILERHGDRLSQLITHRVPLAQGPAAYRMFHDKKESCIKVVLEP